MSAIGDYIHWSYSGYVEKKGHQEEPYFDSAVKIIENRKSMLDDWIAEQGKKTEAEALEQEIDKILQQLKTFKDNSSQKGGDLALHDDAVAQALAKDIFFR